VVLGVLHVSRIEVLGFVVSFFVCVISVWFDVLMYISDPVW